MKKQYLITTLFALLVGCANVPAKENKESSLMKEHANFFIPEGWKVGFKKGHMTELVPENEQVKSWTKLITYQHFTWVKAHQMDAFIKRVSGGFYPHCREVRVELLKEGFQNGYPFKHISIACSKNNISGKGEFYQMKFIGGNTGVYVAQGAFRVEPFDIKIIPSRQLYVEMLNHLVEVKVFPENKARKTTIQVRLNRHER